MGLPIDTVDLKLQRDDEVSNDDQLAVLGSYFPHLNSALEMQKYFAPTNLGAPHKWLVRWRDTPASHWSVFPFPYSIDGKMVIGGKPEASAINPTVIYQPGRPDLFGIVQDALLDHARKNGWPLLVGMTTPLQRKSMRKKGFVDVEMPVLRVFWPLRVAQTQPLVQLFIERQLPRLDAITPALVKRAVSSLFAYPLTWRPRLQAANKSITLTDTGLEALSEAASILEQNYWPKQRLTVWRDPAFWQARFKALPGHRILRVERGQTRGLVFTRLVDGDLRVQDVVPPELMTDLDFWRALLHYSMSIGAGIVTMNFYLNDSFHAEAADVLRQHMKPITRSMTHTYSVLALDDHFKFAYDPNMWVGTNLLMAGF